MTIEPEINCLAYQVRNFITKEEMIQNANKNLFRALLKAKCDLLYEIALDSFRVREPERNK